MAVVMVAMTVVQLDTKMVARLGAPMVAVTVAYSAAELAGHLDIARAEVWALQLVYDLVATTAASMGY